MSQVIHTQLKVSLLDQVTGPMKKVLASNKKLSQQIKKTAQMIEKARGPLRMIEDLRKSNRALSEARRKFIEAQERVRELARQMNEAAKPSARLTAEYRRAQQAVSRAAQVFQRQKEKALGLKRSLEQAGYSVRHLAAAERALREDVAVATRMLERQQAVVERISAARERWQSAAARHGARMAGGYAMMHFGRRALEGMATPVRAAVDFDAAFAQVRKLADFANKEEEKLYKRALVNMSKRIPVAVEGLADIMASALEAGMKPAEALKFTEMTARAKVAFGMSAEAVGEAAAKIKTALGLTVDETHRYMDVMNALSNHMASNAAELIDFTRRVGAQGLQFGFAKEEVTAFGSALIAAGAQPDVAATSFRNMGRALVKGEAATKRQKEAFEALGLSAVDVAKRMQKDAVATTIDVFKRLQALPDYKRATIASQLFGDEARALGPLILKLDELHKALRIARADKLRPEDTLAGEFANRASAADMRFQLLANKVKALGLTIGEILLPPLIQAADAVGKLVDKLAEWAKQYPTATKYAVYAGIGLAGIVTVGGAAAVALGAVGMAASAAAFGMRMLGLRALFAAVSSRKLVGAFGLLSRMKPLRWSALIAPLRWAAFIPRLAWRAFVSPLRWAGGIIPRIPWRSLAGGLRWSALITPLRWGARFIPVIGWAALAGQLVWDLLIKPLGWDKYITAGLKSAWSWVEEQSKAGWEKVRNMEPLDWAKLALTGLPNIINRIVEKFTGINLFDAGAKALSSLWEGMKSIWKGFRKWIDEITASISAAFSGIEPKINAEKRAASRHGPRSGGTMQGIGTIPQRPARKRAVGGLILPGLPTLVGERGPELIYPTRAGWVAHNENVRRLAKMAATASVATPLFVSPPAPAVAAPAAAPASATAVVSPGSRTVQITVAPGAVQIHAAGMGPEAIAEELGRRLGDALRATMADVEDV